MRNFSCLLTGALCFALSGCSTMCDGIQLTTVHQVGCAPYNVYKIGRDVTDIVNSEVGKHKATQDQVTDKPSKGSLAIEQSP